MRKDGFRASGKQKYQCAIRRLECHRRYREKNPEKERERHRRYREKNPEKERESNARRIRIGGMYLGRCGFTKTEREEILNGTSL